MRLFLSSQDFGNYAAEAIKLVGKKRYAIFIKNAQDDLLEEERNFTTPEKKKMFEEAGFTFEEIDLRDYFGKSEALKKALSTAGSVWCAGGNTFILRRAMRFSGLDKILTALLEEDKILYGGWSAGACITSKSLKGIEFGDRPTPGAVPDNYPSKEVIYEGLGFVDIMIIPHCNMEWFKESANQTESYFLNHKVQYKKLNDGQVIVVNGEKMEFLK